MRRVNGDDIEAAGQDSFLDVLTNIVGIIIMLVMVVGLRTSHSVESGELGVSAAAPAKNELHSAVQAAASREADVQSLVERVAELREETLLREEERAWLATFVTAIEQDMDRRRAELSEQERQDFDVRRQLSEAQQTLDDLTRQKISLVVVEPTVEKIECLPTPLAHYVTGKEIHVRLAEGHVALVPLEELLGEFKAQVEGELWRLRERDEFVGTVGPIDGFRLRYCLAKRHVVVRERPGYERQATVVQIAEAKLVPESPRLGEPVDQAMLPTSNFRQAVAKFAPDLTTVTIWTYPGTFDDFRRLKRALFELGYATAGRPLPEGELIGFSPHGTRTVVQ